MNAQAAQNRTLQYALSRRVTGLGFLESEDYYYEDAAGNWYYQDSYGSYWGDSYGNYWDSFGDGGYYYDPYSYDLPYSPADFSLPLDQSAGSGYYTDPYGPTSFGSLWDYINSFVQVDSPGVNTSTNQGGLIPYDPYSQIQEGLDWWAALTGSQSTDANGSSNPALPGYCPQGTYHPIDNPMACVPFPPNDPNAKKQAQQQKKAAQQAASQARAAQKKQDQSCPKDSQGRLVWKNPQTGKCELVPTCPQGTKFDSNTRRCLTPAQEKDLYGDNNWIWWLLGAFGLALAARGGAEYSNRRSRAK